MELYHFDVALSHILAMPSKRGPRPVYHEIFPPLENVAPGGEHFLGFPGNSPPPSPGGIFPRKNTPPPDKSPLSGGRFAAPGGGGEDFQGGGGEISCVPPGSSRQGVGTMHASSNFAASHHYGS